MRRDGTFRCCHSCKSNEDGIDRKGRVGVSGDDDVHCRLEFFIGGGDSGFTVSGFEILPSYGSEHGSNVGVLLDGLLEKVQNGCGDGWVETEHDVSQSSVIDVKPGVNLRLVLGGLGGIRNCFRVGSLCVRLGNGGCGLVIRSREFI